MECNSLVDCIHNYKSGLYPTTQIKMSLLSLTVEKKNGDVTHAGTVLFNSNRIGPFTTIDTNDTFFEFYEAQHTRKPHFDKYEVNETVAAIAALVSSNNKLVYALPVFEDNDATNSSVTTYINTEEIVKGIAHGTTSTYTWLWVEKIPGKVVKYLVNKTLETIKDYVNTGTTTTTTTSTSSTSTTSTTSTHT